MAIQLQTGHRNKDWQSVFLVMLPTIRRCGMYAFRRVRGQEQQDAVQETIANAYVAFVRLVEQDRTDRVYPTALARFAVAKVRADRKVGTKQNTRDVLSRVAQRKRRFKVARMGHVARHQRPWEEVLVADRRTSVPDQAAFRIDFPNWLRQLSSRGRQVAQLLMVGNSTHETARTAGISPARVSQLRRELQIVDGGWAYERKRPAECVLTGGLSSGFVVLAAAPGGVGWVAGARCVVGGNGCLPSRPAAG